MTQIPNPQQNRKVVQLNNTNVNGDLWSSFNIDLTENEGTIRLGKRLIRNSDTASGNTYPVGFAAFGGYIWTIAGTGTGGLYQNPASSLYPSATPFSGVTGSNFPNTGDSTKSDLLVSNGQLFVTGASSSVFYTADGATWSSPLDIGSSDTANPHMLTSYAQRTYCTKSGSKVVSWDNASTPSVATSGQYTLDLGNTASNTITFLRASSNRIWIGTINTLGGKGYIYEWDGSSSSPTKSYRLEAQGALACVIKDDVPYVMDSNGALIVWNGGTFKKLTQLNRRRNRTLWKPTSSVNDRFIHPNGMTLVNGKVNLLIMGQNWDDAVLAASQEVTIPSGVYEYDENHGLYHKHSFGLSTAAGTIVDYGQMKLGGVGGISELNMANNTSSRDGTFMAGVSYYSDTSTNVGGIFYDNSIDTKQKAGYFITTKWRPDPAKLGPAVTGIFNKAFVNYRQFLNPTDRIVLKVRTTEQEPTTYTATWVDGTHLTIASDIIAAYAVGDEVEGMLGQGSGMCAHITALSVSGGTTTVTLDETFPISGTPTALVRLQKWTKLAEATGANQSATFFEAGVSMLASNWAQFKLWMLFTGQDEIESLIVVDKPSRTGQ